MDVHMLRRTLLMSIACIAMWGCSQTNPHAQDPFEGLNRATFRFNKVVDSAVAKPVAYLYLRYLPAPFQVGIGNFFDNLRELPNVANDVLQFKFGYAAHDASRFLINSTIGIFGLFDPASALGLEHRKEDFGQTLYHWGYENSSYLVLPFLGPSTFRDALGMAVDYYAFSVWPWVESDWKYAFLAVDFIDLRARLLRKESVLDVLAVDEYSFMRDAYFQHRKYLFMDSTTENGNDDDIYSDELDEAKNHEKKEEKPAEIKASESVTPSNGDTTQKKDEHGTKTQNHHAKTKKTEQKNAKNEVKNDLQAEPQKKKIEAIQGQTTQNNSTIKANYDSKAVILSKPTTSALKENKIKEQTQPHQSDKKKVLKEAKQQITPIPVEIKKQN